MATTNTKAVQEAKRRIAEIALMLDRNITNTQIHKGLQSIFGTSICRSDLATIRESLKGEATNRPPKKEETKPLKWVDPGDPFKNGRVVLSGDVKDTSVRSYFSDTGIFKWGDRVVASRCSRYTGAEGNIVKFGKSNRDGALGVKIRTDNKIDFWTDLANIDPVPVAEAR